MKSINDTTDPATAISSAKGNRVSGRFWKRDRNRFQSVNKNKALKTTWEQKEKLRKKKQEVLEMARNIEEEKKKKKRELKERQARNKESRKVNQEKGEVVQVVTNTRKLLRLKKKELKKNYKTRDVTNKKSK